MSLDDSYAACRAITQKHARSFYFSSHTLPASKRRDAYAVYAFCRHMDDEVDLAESDEARAAALARLRQLTQAAFDPAGAGEFTALDWMAAFRDTCQRRLIPQQHFLDLLAGVEMDHGRVRLQTWEELRKYCYHVASVVGLMMVHVLAEPRDEMLEPAIDLGLGMQLTNILRDISEDFENDRIYLPAEELECFGLDESWIRDQRADGKWLEFMRWQIDRAREFYVSSEKGIRLLPRDGSQLTVWLMREIYAAILDEIEKVKLNNFGQRVHTSTTRKLQLAFRAWRRSILG